VHGQMSGDRSLDESLNTESGFTAINRIFVLIFHQYRKKGFLSVIKGVAVSYAVLRGLLLVKWC
jgi:hypothetical protein